jgi:DNA-binding response OmpR family regulator
MRAALAAVWAEHRDGVVGRLAVLEEAVAALLAGTLDGELRDAARRQAHQLAGTVGTFGFAAAGERAGELERAFAGPGQPAYADAPRLAELVLAIERELTDESPPAAPTEVDASPGEGISVAVLAGERNDERSTILAVDDDRDLLAAVRALVSTQRWTLATCDDPKRFWRALEETAPELVMLDVDMPEVGGLELCRALRDDPRWASLPVLFLTGRTDRATLTAVFEAGADDYVPKPIVAGELLTRISNRLERARLLRESSRTGQLTGLSGRSPAERELESVAGSAAEGAGPPEVLVVEDDEALAHLVLHALRTRGYRTRWLADGMQAAAALSSAEGAGPRVVLLDWDLPALDGLGVLQAMAQAGALARTRVIMLTSHSAEREVLEALELGAFDHVAKPVSVPVLMRRVHVALEA